MLVEFGEFDGGVDRDPDRSRQEARPDLNGLVPFGEAFVEPPEMAQETVLFVHVRSEADGAAEAIDRVVLAFVRLEPHAEAREFSGVGEGRMARRLEVSAQPEEKGAERRDVLYVVIEDDGEALGADAARELKIHARDQRPVDVAPAVVVQNGPFDDLQGDRWKNAFPDSSR